MSLYFNDRINEQKEDPLKDTVTFTYPWVITSPPPDQQQHFPDIDQFVTNYKFATGTCTMFLFNGELRISCCNWFGRPLMLNGTCFISYNIFYDNGMRFLFYSSPKIKMIKEREDRDSFKTPDGFMTKYVEASDQRKIAKMVIFVELRFSTKYFFRPFEAPGCHLSKIGNGKVYDEYPEDMENDYRFACFKKSDYTIKCPDGEVPCRRAALNVTSKFFKEHFTKSKDNELIVEHAIDVVKPVIIYLHTYCFKMPKVYDHDFAKRLFIAIDFFKVERRILFKEAVHKALCCKFVSEYNDFDSILRWTSLASRQYLHYLGEMIAAVIADKYYFKWHQTFPENARNFEHPLFLDIFASEDPGIFIRIDQIFENSFLTNVILD